MKEVRESEEELERKGVDEGAGKIEMRMLRGGREREGGRR